MIFFRRRNSKSLSTSQQQPYDEHPIKHRLADNIAEIRNIFEDTPDLVVRNFVINQTRMPASLVYLSGLIDKKAINNNVLNPLIFGADNDSENFDPTVTLGGVEKTGGWGKIRDAILQGKSVLFVDKQAEAFIYDTQGWPQRSLEDSQIEPSLKGAHIGFTETGGQNIALIRRHIVNQELKIKEFTVGERGKTKLSIL